VYDNYIRLIVKTDRQERSVAGTVFSDGKPRIIQIKGINMEAEVGPAHDLHRQLVLGGD
jgi:D-3-phosphoglycerate dehydrogenase